MSTDMPKIDPPDTAEPVKKRRGRPPGSKNKSTSPKLPPAAGASDEPASLDSKKPTLSDSETGRVIAGAFMVTGLGLGPHWRLFPHEEYELGRCLGPLARRYPEKIGAYADLLMCGPVIAAVVVPRIGVQVAIQKGEVPREKGREALGYMLSIMEAEKKKTMGDMVTEGESLIKRIDEAQAAEQVTT